MDQKERRGRRAFQDFLAQKETRVRREKMVLQEILVPKELRDPKVLRVGPVSQGHQGHLDLQDQREREGPPECQDTPENQEKREIPELRDQEGETDLKE